MTLYILSLSLVPFYPFILISIYIYKVSGDDERFTDREDEQESITAVTDALK